MFAFYCRWLGIFSTNVASRFPMTAKSNNIQMQKTYKQTNKANKQTNKQTNNQTNKQTNKANKMIKKNKGKAQRFIKHHTNN
jgi:hypothetical protein